MGLLAMARLKMNSMGGAYWVESSSWFVHGLKTNEKNRLRLSLQAVFCWDFKLPGFAPRRASDKRALVAAAWLCLEDQTKFSAVRSAH
jgi:hypothetical protein